MTNILIVGGLIAFAALGLIAILMIVGMALGKRKLSHEDEAMRRHVAELDRTRRDDSQF